MYQMTVAEAMDLCFDGDTTVKTLNGDKKIKDVTVGDFVLSRDEETGEQDYKRVTKRFVNESTELVHITVGGATISATPSHPFFADGKGWVYAGQLEVGDVLLTAENEQVSVTDIATEHFDEPQATYNLEVEDWHTYFVSAVGVWAHNRCVNGYFGDPAKTSDVRHMQGGILAALSLFNEITEGYTTENIIYYKTGAIKGYVREMPGGGKVTYRMSSTSDGTPVININGMLDEYYIKNQKIHFLP
jgi:hypothetical protein